MKKVIAHQFLAMKLEILWCKYICIGCPFNLEASSPLEDPGDDEGKQEDPSCHKPHG